ncbi:MAG: GntR family transcriptional regulator [Pleomorphochaeta sp.]
MSINLKDTAKSKKDIYYELILNRIIKCEYVSNDIITEKGLVDEFGVSKSPIREALLELCNEGYLKSIPRFGYQILNFDEKTIQEITEYRVCLEYSSMDRFWDRKDLKKFQEIEKFMSDNYDDTGKRKASLDYWKLNTEFHVMLISLFNNSYATDRLRDAMRFLGVAYAQSYWINYHTETITTECFCHKDMVEAIKNNDKEKALRILYEDINNFNKLEKQ